MGKDDKPLKDQKPRESEWDAEKERLAWEVICGGGCERQDRGSGGFFIEAVRVCSDFENSLSP